jgi:hypothetical protein
MLSSWYDCLARSANWWTIALALTLTAVCMWGFNGRALALRRDHRLGAKEKLLDGRWWYTPTDAASLFEQLGGDGRRLYAVSEVTLDLIFPFAYGLSFALLLVRLWPRDQAWLLLLPFIAVLADLLENVTIAVLAWTYKGAPSALAKPAAILTATKQVFLTLVLIALVIGLVRVPFRGAKAAVSPGVRSY